MATTTNLGLPLFGPRGVRGDATDSQQIDDVTQILDAVVMTEEDVYNVCQTVLVTGLPDVIDMGTF